MITRGRAPAAAATVRMPRRRGPTAHAEWTSAAAPDSMRLMQALELHLTVDDALVRALPALEGLLGQHIELIALGEEEEARPSRRAPVPGALAGKIGLKENFDAPLPDDLQLSFEGHTP